jgi:hypothetical protein
MMRLAIHTLAYLGFAVALAAQDPKPVEKKDPPKYKPNDRTRPRPKVIEPPTASTEEQPGKPPSDAVILFDGKDLSEWTRDGKKPDDPDAAPKWKVENGYAEISRGGGGIRTKKKFGDSQIHIEWATPKEVKGSDQGRGNSGLYLGGFSEIQILDSFNNDTYPDGQAAGLYGKLPPLVNASRKPGEWQSYDIVARLAKTDESGKIIRPANLTVFHNGIVVHLAVEFPGKFGPFDLYLQDHGNPIRFRNIWVRKVGEYDEDATPPPVKEKK